MKEKTAPKENKKIVILVEDDPAIIDVYTTAFKNADLDLRVISTGKQAIKIIKESKDGPDGLPSLVLLDLILPDMNGVEVLKEVKTNENTKSVPVFILSNQATLGAEEAGAPKPDKFIIKANITPTQLVELIIQELNK